MENKNTWEEKWQLINDVYDVLTGNKILCPQEVFMNRYLDLELTSKGEIIISGKYRLTLSEM